MKRPPIVGMALALAAGLLLGLLLFRSTAPAELTSGELADARSRWEANGPSSYIFELQMGGALDDRRRIEVHDGVVVAMTSNEQPSAESSWEHWSVDAMFGFLETELRNAADPKKTLGVADASQVVLRADFDPQLGYPSFFFRHLLGRQQSTEWKVVRFESRDQPGPD